MAYRWCLVFVSIVLSAIAPTQLKALSPADGPIGATSRSTIRIEASVAPRLGFRGPGTFQSSNTGHIISFCVWSSSPLRRYTLTLFGRVDGSLDQDGEITSDGPTKTNVNTSSTRLSAGKPFAAIARSSVSECNRPGSNLNLALDLSRETAAIKGGTLLILAPE